MQEQINEINENKKIKNKKNIKDIKNMKNYLNNKPILQTLLSFLLIMFCELMVSYIISYQASITGATNIQKDSFTTATTINQLLYNMFIIVITVLTEEFIFRKVIINLIGKFSVTALYISSFLFAFAHYFDLITFPFYFIAGMILGKLFINTKDIKYPIITHLLVNYTIMLIYYII